MSSLDSRQTFINLLDEGDLDPSFRDEVMRYKYRGSSGKVNLALSGLPELACKPGVGPWLRGAISFSPSLDYMERAYDDAKYGRPSERPYIDCIMPTLVDPTMAPPGKHVMSCFVQYAPYHLEDGEQWDDAKREAFGQNVIDTLEERFPNIRSLIEGQQFVTPKDIEDITGLSEGQHLRRRALAGAALLQPAGARVGALRDAGEGPLDVRLGDAPRRRHHGRARHDRGARVPEAAQARKEGGLDGAQAPKG